MSNSVFDPRGWTSRYPFETAADPDIDAEIHDFRDRGDPIEKREPGSWSDWVNRQDVDMNLRGRR